MLSTTASVLEKICAQIDATPQRRALGITDGKQYSFISYAELSELVDGVAAGLIARGINSGDRVALLLADRATWGIFYLGLLRAGATVVPLDNLQKPLEWATIIKEAEAWGVIVSSAYDQDLQEECGEIPANWLVVKTEDQPQLFDRVPRSLTAPLPSSWPEITGGMIAALVFTSGTTSAPKGVILTHRNLAADVEAIHGLDFFNRDDCFFSVLPIHHTFECTAGFLNPLCKGASIAYARSLKSKEIFADLQASRATIMLSVPLLFEKIVQAIRRGLAKQPPARRAAFKLLYQLSKQGKRRFKKMWGQKLFRPLRQKAGLGDLRLLVSGGAALSPEVGEFLDLLGLPLLQGYGLTESSPVLSVNPPQGYKYETVGPALPGVEMKILQPDASGVGEIVARGEMITPGYFNRPEETEKLFTDGWLRTGDLGWCDEDKHFHITGRAKNLIVTPAGKNVYPEEIEMLLAESPLILEVLVYGEILPGETRERIGCAVVPDLEFIALEHGEIPQPQIEQMLTTEVRRICEQIAAYKRPTEIIFRETEFVKTSTKKIKRFLFARSKEEQFPFAANDHKK